MECKRFFPGFRIPAAVFLFTLDDIRRYENDILTKGSKHFDKEKMERTFKWTSPDGVTFTVATFIEGSGNEAREVVNTVYTDRTKRQTRRLADEIGAAKVQLTGQEPVPQGSAVPPEIVMFHNSEGAEALYLSSEEAELYAKDGRYDLRKKVMLQQLKDYYGVEFEFADRTVTMPELFDEAEKVYKDPETAARVIAEAIERDKSGQTHSVDGSTLAVLYLELVSRNKTFLEARDAMDAARGKPDFAEKQAAYNVAEGRLLQMASAVANVKRSH